MLKCQARTEKVNENFDSIYTILEGENQFNISPKSLSSVEGQR